MVKKQLELVLVNGSAWAGSMRLQCIVLCFCIIGGLTHTRAWEDQVPSRTLLESTPPDDNGFIPRFSSSVPAVKGRYPYAVSLVDSSNSHFCGGVLVSRMIVATAADCLQSVKKPRIHLGGLDRNDPQEVKQTVKVLYHPKWQGNSRSGKNIALLKLDSSTTLQPVQLPSPNINVQNDDILYGIGWGRQSSTGSFSNSLQVAAMPFVPTPVCNKMGLMNGNVIPDYLCAGGVGADMCEGDKGAPLIRQAGNSMGDCLVGLAAFHDGTCGDSGRPSIYLRVGVFGSWISEQIKLQDAP